jgi:hypothetical protein
MLASEGRTSTKFRLDFNSKLCLACPSDAGRWGPDFEVRLFYCIRVAEFRCRINEVTKKYLFSTWCVTYLCNLDFFLIKPVVVLIGFNCVSCPRIHFHMGHVEQQLLERYHFVDDIQKQNCSQQGLYDCWQCTEIMMDRLMTCLNTSSAVILQLQDVSIFVNEFLVPQSWSPDFKMVATVWLYWMSGVSVVPVSHRSRNVVSTDKSLY